MTTEAPATEVAATEAAATAPPASTVIAVWKGGTVSDGQLADWLRFLRREDQPQHRREQIEAMLLIETLAAAARERGADRQPATRRALDGAREQTLAAALKSYRGERIAISDEDVEAFLRKYPDTLKRPRKVRLRSITKGLEPDARAEEKTALRRRMREILTELEAGADFAAMARRESESQSRFQGGLIGNVPAGRLRPEVDVVAMGLGPGELSGVIDTGDGLTILECETIIEAYEPGPEEQTQGTASHLRRRRVKRDWEDFQAELLRQARPRFDLAAARRTAAGPEDVVARFDGGQLTRVDLREALRSGVVKRDAGTLGDEALRRILERLVIRARSARRARDLGLDQDPELEERLAWRRLQVLAGDELRRRIQERLEPHTQQQIRTYFEAHRERFRRPPHYDLAIIRIDLEAGRERQLYRRADELREQLAAGDLDFPGAARTHSAHPSAERGGALGWVSRRQVAGFGPLVQKHADGLAPGQTSELLQRERSLFILRLNDRQEARPLTWEEASATAEARLGQEQVAEIQERIEQRLKADLEVRLLPEPAPEAK